ncbi:MAG: hypothetical protein HXS54_05870 [Theionarchaea archaeon]|nr:hypothetical protein [Theionarchaea archaeon]DBA34895.1 TPA_asm: hypothetical protein vir521_00101 [Caudoviricetes sp. vir521]
MLRINMENLDEERRALIYLAFEYLIKAEIPVVLNWTNDEIRIELNDLSHKTFKEKFLFHVNHVKEGLNKMKRKIFTWEKRVVHEDG